MEKVEVETLIREAKIEAMQQLVDEALASGLGAMTFAEIREKGRELATARQKAGFGVR